MGPPYLVVYRIEPSVVVILRVPHGAHRWRRDAAATNPPLLIEVAVSERGLGFCHRRYVTAGAAEIIGFVRDAQAKGANRGRGAVGSVASPRQPRARRHGHQLGRCQGTDRMAAGVMSARIEAWESSA